MKIRVGFEITYDFVARTPMMLMLNVHPSRAADVIKPDQLRVSPAVPFTRYLDAFGNVCTRLVAPPGQLEIFTDALVADFRTAGPGGAGGAPARSRRTAARRPRVPAGQPILRDRAPDGGRMVALRPDAAGLGAGAGDLRFHPFPCALRLSARARHQDRDRRHHRAPRRVPRLCPSRDHTVPLHEHPGTLLHRLSGRHRRAAGARSDGFQRLVRGLSRRPLVRVRCPPQHSAHRPHRHGARPDAADVAFSTTFGPNVLRRFVVHTDEAPAAEMEQVERKVA